MKKLLFIAFIISTLLGNDAKYYENLGDIELAKAKENYQKAYEIVSKNCNNNNTFSCFLSQMLCKKEWA